jgi:hypothetical protein
MPGKDAKFGNVQPSLGRMRSVAIAQIQIMHSGKMPAKVVSANDGVFADNTQENVATAVAKLKPLLVHQFLDLVSIGV